MPSCPPEGTIFEEGGKARFLKEGGRARFPKEGGRTRLLKEGKISRKKARKQEFLRFLIIIYIYGLYLADHEKC